MWIKDTSDLAVNCISSHLLTLILSQYQITQACFIHFHRSGKDICESKELIVWIKSCSLSPPPPLSLFSSSAEVYLQPWVCSLCVAALCVDAFD